MKMLTISWEDVQAHLLALSEKIERDGYAPDMMLACERFRVVEVFER